MKKIIYSLIFILFGWQAQAQTLYYDALKLSQALNNNDMQEIYTLLGTHGNFLDMYQVSKTQSLTSRGSQAQDKLSIVDAREIYREYMGNPYMAKILQQYDPTVANRAISDSVRRKIRDYSKFSYKWQEQLYGVPEEKKNDEEMDYRDLVDESEVTSSSEQLNDVAENLAVRTSNQAGLSASALAEGVGQFVAERAKDELSLAFLDAFKQRLNDSSYIEFRLLFPTTIDFLEEFDPSNFNTVMQLSKKSFETDLQKLAFNIPKVMSLDKYKYTQNSPEVFTLAMLYESIDLVFKGTEVTDVMLQLHTKLKKRSEELDKQIYLQLAQKIQGTTDVDVLSHQISTFGDSLNQRLDEKDQFATEMNDYLRQLIKYKRRDELRDLNSVANNFNSTVLSISRWANRDRIKEITYGMRGDRYYDDLVANADLDDFDKLFNHETSEIENIANGLLLANKLVTPDEFDRQTVAQKMDALNQIRYNVRKKTETAKMGRSASEWLDEFYNRINNIATNVPTDLAAIKQMNGQNTDETNDVSYEMAKLDFLRMALLRDTSALVAPIKQRIEADQKKNKTTDPNIVSKLAAFIRDIEQRITDVYVDIYYKTGYWSDFAGNLYYEYNVDENVQSNKTAKSELQKMSDSINNQLNNLKLKYCASLVQAKNFTEKFAKNLEYTVNMLYALRDSSGWLSKDQYNEIMDNENMRNIYMGLLFQRMYQVYPSSSKRAVNTAITKYSTLMYNLSAYNDSISRKRKNGDNLGFWDFFPGIKYTFGVMNTGISVLKQDSAYRSLQTVSEMSNQTMEMLENTYKKNYGFAIYNSMEMLRLLAPAPLTKDELQAKASMIAAEQGIEEDDAEKMLVRQRRRQSLLINSVLRYGTFMASVVSARTSEDVKRAVESAALPVGSSRIKRETRFNIAVNSYFSPFGGVRITSDNVTSPSFGLTAPVGIAISTGRAKIGSFSLFAPIIDVGAVTAFSMDSNKGQATMPELSFKNLIAPGLFLIYGVPKSPFSLGGGIQYGPADITQHADGTSTTKGAYRIMFHVGVDIPVFNLYKSAQ